MEIIVVSIQQRERPSAPVILQLKHCGDNNKSKKYAGLKQRFIEQADSFLQVLQYKNFSRNYMLKLTK